MWRHIRENDFKSVVVLTDGYVGKVEPQFRSLKKLVNIQFLITPKGGKMMSNPFRRDVRSWPLILIVKCIDFKYYFGEEYE